MRERPLRFCMVTTFYPPYHFGGDAVFVHRLAEALVGIVEPECARLVLVLLRQPSAVMAPHARAFLALVGIPVGDVDIAGAPAVFHHEVRRRP